MARQPIDLLWVLLDASADLQVSHLSADLLKRHGHLKLAAFAGDRVEEIGVPLVGKTTEVSAGLFWAVLLRLRHFSKLKKK